MNTTGNRQKQQTGRLHSQLERAEELREMRERQKSLALLFGGFSGNYIYLVGIHHL